MNELSNWINIVQLCKVLQDRKVLAALRGPRGTMVTTACLVRRGQPGLQDTTARRAGRARRVTTGRRVPPATLVATATTAGT